MSDGLPYQHYGVCAMECNKIGDSWLTHQTSALGKVEPVFICMPCSCRLPSYWSRQRLPEMPEALKAMTDA